MTKYKQFFNEMLTKHKDDFDEFKKIHDLFEKDRLMFQDEFNRQGLGIMDIIIEWEKRLCRQMEGGKNSVYSANLSEKFRDEIKKIYPKLDLIGVRLTMSK